MNAYYMCLNLNRVVWATVALLLLVPGLAQSQFTYVSDGSAITITGYTGTNSAVVIPDTIAGLPVTTLSSTNLGQSIFAGATNITSVTISTNVTTIGDYAFNACGLTNLVIPDSVASLGDWSFEYCTNLTSARIGNGVTNIGDYDFVYCTNLSSAAIGTNVMTIGFEAFDDCFNLQSLALPGSVASIGNLAFYSCLSLTNITMPSSITNIGQYAFWFCTSLTSITIPKNVTFLDSMTFQDCSNLTAAYFEGNAPGSVPPVFTGNTNVTAYYLPGTSGWTNALANAPALLWNPTFQTRGAGLGVQNNQFSFNINGTANIPIEVDTRTNLKIGAWAPVLTCTLTNGSLYFSSPLQTNYSRDFFRIRSPL